MNGFVSTLATIWRLAIPYFRSEDRLAGRMLLAAVVAIELAMVGINVLINQWNARFYNALQDRNWDALRRASSLFFCVLAGTFIVLAVYQLYLNQWLQIRWRRFMTAPLSRRNGSNGANHYRMQLARRRRRQPGPAHRRGHQAVHRWRSNGAESCRSGSACSTRWSRSARS